jgi:hypothetical protein
LRAGADHTRQKVRHIEWCTGRQERSNCVAAPQHIDTHAQQMFGHWLLAHTEEAAGRVGIEHAKLDLQVPPQPRDSCSWSELRSRSSVAVRLDDSLSLCFFQIR